MLRPYHWTNASGSSLNTITCPVKFPLLKFLRALLVKVTAIAYVPILWLRQSWITSWNMIVVSVYDIWMIEWCLTDTRGWKFMKLSTPWSHFLRFSHESSLAWFDLSGECLPVHLILSHEQSAESFGIWSDGPLVPHVPPLAWWRKKTLEWWNKKIGTWIEIICNEVSMYKISELQLSI